MIQQNGILNRKKKPLMANSLVPINRSTFRPVLIHLNCLNNLDVESRLLNNKLKCSIFSPD